MHVRSLGFRTDLALLTLTGSVVEDRGTHLVVRTPDNPTFWWGNFLLLAQPPVAGGEREVVAAHWTEFGQEFCSIGIDLIEDEAVEAAVAKRFAEADERLSVDRGVVLTATSVHQPLRPMLDAEVRPLVSEEDWEARAQLSLALNDADPDRPEDNESHLLFARRRNAQEQALVGQGLGQRYGVFVRHDGGETLASTAAIYRTEEGLARFQTVETHPQFRRQGLAATVVHAAGRHALDELGARTLVIVADADGDAIRIYRRLGFADTERQLMVERRPRRSRARDE